MIQAFVITLREGLESFLIIAFTLAYLRKSGRRELIGAVHWGIALSILVSVGAGFLFQRANNQALWEGILALAAAVMVSTLTVHMWRAAKRMRKEIEGRLEQSALKGGRAAYLGVFLFTLLMISREGMETTLLLAGLVFQFEGMSVLLGGLAGTLVSAGIAWLWTKYGYRVNIGRFFQVTAVFLFVFVIQLLIYGFHELTEADILPYSEPLHWATEPYGPDGIYGKYLSYMLVLLPLGWLIASTLRSGGRGHAVQANPGAERPA